MFLRRSVVCHAFRGQIISKLPSRLRFESTLGAVRTATIASQSVSTSLSLLKHAVKHKEQLEDEHLAQISRAMAKMDIVPSEVVNLSLQLSATSPNFVSHYVEMTQDKRTPDKIALIVSLLLQNRQIVQAAEYVAELLRSNEDVRGTTIELLIRALLAIEKFEGASALLSLARSQGIEIYSRTLKTLLDTIIKQEMAELAYEHYRYIITKAYFSKESLFQLMLLVSKVGYVREVRAIFKMVKRNDNKKLSRRMSKGYDSALLECATRLHGLKKGLSMLEKKNRLPNISIDKYPVMIDALPVSSNPRKIKLNLLRKMVYSHLSLPVRKYYLKLMITKLCQQHRVDVAIDVLKSLPILIKYVDNQILSAIITEMKTGQSIAGSAEVRNLLDIIERKQGFKLYNHNALDDLFELVICSEYWFRVFKLYKFVNYDGFKIKPELRKRLETLSQEHGFTTQFNELSDCI